MNRTAALLAACLAAPLFGQTTPAPTPAKPPTPTEVEKAQELFKSNKVGEALDALAKAGKTNPLLSPPKVQVAQWYFQVGNGQAARLFLEQALTEDPKHPEGYLLNASFAAGEGRLTDAFLSLRVALDLAADARWDADQKKRFAREARTGLVDVCSARGDLAAAKEYALELLNADPKNGVQRSWLAGILFRMDKPAEAEKELVQAFADDPAVDPPPLQLATLWQQRANAENDPLKQAAHLEKAEGWYQKAVTNHPKNAKATREYAIWLIQHNRADAAGPYLDVAVKLDPTGKDTSVTKAVWLMHRKDFAAAEPLLEAAYKDAPTDLGTLSFLCLCLAESGDEKRKKRATDLAEIMVKQSPRSVNGYAVLGWCQYRLGRADEAERSLVPVLNSGQISFDAAYYIARIFADKKKYDEANKMLTGALAAQHGLFLFRPEAKALQSEVAKQVPGKDDKKEEPKKP